MTAFQIICAVIVYAGLIFVIGRFCAVTNPDNDLRKD